MILEVKELNKQYERPGGKFYAVRNVSLCVEKGDFVAITGPSGGGKSTLFHMISGLLRPTSGSVLIEEIDIIGRNQKELSWIRREKIGYIMQGQNLLPNFNILDNVCMPYYMTYDRGRRGKAISKRGEELLKLVGLEDRSAGFPAELSGGELQRAAIARALILSPPIVLADEPTASLDPRSSLQIIKLLELITQQGTTVIASTHNHDLLPNFNKSYTMTAGQLTNSGKCSFR